ncbi:MAG: serine--tRNA ligase [Phycisphaerae bacterium]|nr:MAG: serine--tRNA ligase [Planctomycetia bacterium]RIK66992.1 MAG: serine--tRNA ligase [Planctomycetota bacterium]GJQ26001.1 MAG: serine--tRNA ligase [Phycisphaerae bacterium]
MLDIKFIRDNLDAVRQAARNKNIQCDLDRLIAVDDRRRALQTEADNLRNQSNELSSQVGLYKNPKSKWFQEALAKGATAEQLQAEGEKIQAQSAVIKQRIKELEEEARTVGEEFRALMLTVPQVPSARTPIGRDAEENVEVRRVGTPRTFEFEPKDHVKLGEALGILDIERGVKLAGTRNYLLRGAGCLLHHAVLRLAMDTIVSRGFEPLTVPILVNDAQMYGTGYYPGGEEQAYRCERDGKSLVGTAEVSLTAMYGDEILDEAMLPVKLAAVSTCFRREAGAAGKDTYGIYRIHFFDKVEQVVLCRADDAESEKHHHEIIANAEAVLTALELPYRVMMVCTGDMGQGKVEMYDIETWMPSRNGYGETHSASRFGEFQARRLNLRYRGGDKKTYFCHTLNNTVIASPRILIPILEQYQNADGSVTVPKVLRPYMGGMERIGP